MTQLKFSIIVTLAGCGAKFSSPVSHARDVALVAADEARVSGINFRARSDAIERRMIERNGIPVGALGELISARKVAKRTVRIDRTRMHQLGKCEEAIARVSCEMQQFFVVVQFN